jgi:hypothetical protein
MKKLKWRLKNQLKLTMVCSRMISHIPLLTRKMASSFFVLRWPEMNAEVPASKINIGAQK